MLPDGLNIKPQKLNENMEPEDSDDSEDKPSRRNGRRKIKIEYIEDKNRRHITFSKRKAGIMKKAYELSTLTGTQVLLLVVSETGLVYTFTTTKLQPIVTKPEGKNLIQACLNTPDPEAATTDDTTTTTTTTAAAAAAVEKDTTTAKIAGEKKTEEPIATSYRQDSTTKREANPLSPQPVNHTTTSPQTNPRQPRKYPQYQQMPMPYNQRYLGYNGNLPPSNYPPYGQPPFYHQSYPGNTNNPSNYWQQQPPTSPAERPFQPQQQQQGEQ
ncbi:hypothetical protein G6F46_000973 [Rhizopus delemar]|uniref:MADS-box domain-containing protein n=2 Tax=Rhizopus TaxID=4842 RepID=A0A9P6Z8Q6_9FUNG|nr:hypothetical protein G6F55_004794 [Rhizopus delemar]KAG1548629.1 hypothetical protein G6F51_003546 [Rhizopus arrhizus]KAG1498201.1 hypothetical protein G6F54_005244 [Rhizopus delemar]KAG1515368.1 hypothetical protein G6F53_002969 [Rhizopus delemar]KAG1516865.1 hypothetical protein G6F52_009352 [Rhizopus delemar]